MTEKTADKLRALREAAEAAGEKRGGRASWSIAKAEYEGEWLDQVYAEGPADCDGGRWPVCDDCGDKQTAAHIANMDPHTTLALLEGWKVMQEALIDVGSEMALDLESDVTAATHYARDQLKRVNDALARAQTIAEGIK